MSGLGTWDSEYLLNNTLVDTTSRRSGEKKCKYDTGNHGGRSQFYFYTIYHVLILVHRLLLGKWHSNPPSVMAKTFVCQCRVTLE